MPESRNAISDGDCVSRSVMIILLFDRAGVSGIFFLYDSLYVQIILDTLT